MNIVLISKQETDLWQITDQRQIQHIYTHLKAKVGDTLKVGIVNHARYDCEIVAMNTQCISVKALQRVESAPKIPVTLIVALPRPKVLRRLVADSVSLGVEKLVLIHSYRVDKSYWQSPFLSQLNHYAQLGLEQSGDVMMPEIMLEKRFKPFVEDKLSVWSQQSPTFVAHPYAEKDLPVVLNQPCQIVIGAEGGFIPYEIELLEKNGAQICKVGQRILRTETAVPFVLSRLFI